MATALLASLMPILAIPPAIFPSSKWRHRTSVTVRTSVSRSLVNSSRLQTHREAVNPALYAVLAIQRAQGDPQLAAAFTEVTGSIDVEHDASGNTIQCPDSG
jgi:hypothetical protein